MSTTRLVNLRVAILVSDPWDFGTEHGTGPFVGTISDVTDERLVIQLRDPIAHSGRMLCTAVAMARHVGDAVHAVAKKTLSVNLVLLPLKITHASELAPDLMRDGVNVIGSVELVA